MRNSCHCTLNTFQSRNGLIWTDRASCASMFIPLFQSRNGLIWTLIREQNVAAFQRFNPATVWFEHLLPGSIPTDICVSIPQRSDLNLSWLSWFLFSYAVSIPQRSDLNLSGTDARWHGDTKTVSIPQRSDLNIAVKDAVIPYKTRFNPATVWFELFTYPLDAIKRFRVSIPQRSDLNLNLWDMSSIFLSVSIPQRSDLNRICASVRRSIRMVFQSRNGLIWTLSPVQLYIDCKWFQSRNGLIWTGGSALPSYSL